MSKCLCRSGIVFLHAGEKVWDLTVVEGMVVACLGTNCVGRVLGGTSGSIFQLSGIKYRLRRDGEYYPVTQGGWALS